MRAAVAGVWPSKMFSALRGGVGRAGVGRAGVGSGVGEGGETGSGVSIEDEAAALGMAAVLLIRSPNSGEGANPTFSETRRGMIGMGGLT